MPTEEEYKTRKEIYEHGVEVGRKSKEAKPAKPINIKVRSMNNALGALFRR